MVATRFQGKRKIPEKVKIVEVILVLSAEGTERTLVLSSFIFNLPMDIQAFTQSTLC